MAERSIDQIAMKRVECGRGLDGVVTLSSAGQAGGSEPALGQLWTIAADLDVEADISDRTPQEIALTAQDGGDLFWPFVSVRASGFAPIRNGAYVRGAAFTLISLLQWISCLRLTHRLGRNDR
jgi:hypothetical protein